MLSTNDIIKIFFFLFFYRYDPGGGCDAIRFIYRVEPEKGLHEMLTQATRMVHLVTKYIPVYHTRTIRKQFYQETSFLAKESFKPHALQHNTVN